MNTEIAVHPKLLHYGLTTGNLNAMLDWYRKVLGMTVNHRSALPAEALSRAPFSAMAFISNDETDHRIVLFEVPESSRTATKAATLGCSMSLSPAARSTISSEPLFGSSALGILPLRAADHGVGTAFYYADPDQNIVELSVNNYGDDWTATEHLRTAPPVMALVDPDKMHAARKTGGSPWDVHERAVAGEFAPDEPQDPRAFCLAWAPDYGQVQTQAALVAYVSSSGF